MAAFHPVTVAVGSVVRGAIAQAGLTQLQAATDSGMSLKSLSRRINGTLPFTLEELAEIAEVVDVPLEELTAAAVRLASKAKVPA